MYGNHFKNVVTIMGNVSFFFRYKKRDVIDVVFHRRFLNYYVNSTSLVLSWRLTYIYIYISVKNYTINHLKLKAFKATVGLFPSPNPVQLKFVFSRNIYN